jgi:hypothetical protein
MEAMIFAKAAAENGGKVDMLTVEYTTEYGYGEGEMFFKHFLPQFAWFDYVRPLDKDDIFNWRPKKEGTELKEVKRREPPKNRKK